MSDDSYDLCTISEAAKALGVSRGVMYRWLNSADRPKFFVKIGARWKVSVPALGVHVEPDPKPQPCVYFALRGGLVKIGTSVQVEKRLAQLFALDPKAGPLALIGTIPGSYPEEHAMHKRFEDLRVEGEWFALEGALEEFIRQEFGTSKESEG